MKQKPVPLAFYAIQDPAKISWLSSVLRLRQHSIDYTADGFYRSKDRTNSIKILKEKSHKGKNQKRKQQNAHIHTQ